MRNPGAGSPLAGFRVLAFAGVGFLFAMASRASASPAVAEPGSSETPPGPAVAAPGPAAPAPTGGATLTIDPVRSSLDFIIHRPGETIEGHAHQFTGEVVFDAAHPENRPSVALRVQAASLETGNRVRDHKMRGSHLEVERFPEILFHSTSIRLTEAVPEAGVPDRAGPGPGGAPPPAPSGGGRRALLEGILSLHGVERSMLFPATIRYDNGSLTAEGEATLSLTDHSIPIPRFLWIVLDDEVKVRFRFVASPAGSG